MNNVAGRLEKETKFYESMENKLTTMAPIFKEYYIFMRANRMSYSTIREYMNQVLHFANFITKGNVTNNFYEDITPNDVETYIISLETRQTKKGIKKMGDDILQTRWSSLNKFFGWLVKKGYIKENPIVAVDRPSNNVERKIVYLNKSEIVKLFDAVDKNPNYAVRLRDKALFSLAIATGLRASALTNINLDDFDWENRFVRVIEKRQKTREILLGDNTINILKEWITVRNREFADVDSSALFISQKKNRLSGDAGNDALKKYCQEAGIKKKVTLHKLRASAATNLAAANVDIQTIGNILGHKSTATTLKYVAVLDESKKNAVNVLDKLI